MLSLRRVVSRVSMLAVVSLGSAHAQTPGVSDAEIRIGNISPYTGPMSGYAAVGNTLEAYFKKINEEGGVNGRRLKLVSVDDGSSPPRTLEQTRRLIEREEVFLMASGIGTAGIAVAQRYLNPKGVPQLFPNSGASRWNNPKEFKWTVPALGRPNQDVEARIYAGYLQQQSVAVKIGVLYQNDDYGKDFLTGFRRGFGDNAARNIVAEKAYDISDPTIDSQVDALRASGADTLVLFALPKFCAQAIRRAVDTGWKPRIVVGMVCSSIDFALKPAGLEKSTGVITAMAMKDPNDPRFATDVDVKEFKAFMSKYYPSGGIDMITASTYMSAYSLVEVLKRSGKNLTRAGVLETATSLKDWKEPLLLDGLSSNLTSVDYISIRSAEIVRFSGAGWKPVAKPGVGKVGGKS
jgi:branched-chain amino acid transport system substrate-binding protein